MAKLRTAYEFLEFLDTEAAWRKRELSSVDSALGDAQGHWEQSLIRMGIVMLCAHWEGFVKSAACTYLDYIEEQISRNKISFDALSPHFKGLSMWRIYKRGGDTGFLKFVDTLAAYFSTTAAEPRLPNRSVISTESNLTAKRFKRILRTIGLTDAALEAHALVIQETIVAQRHLIAHGRYTGNITPAEYSDLAKDLVQGLDQLSTILLDAAVDKRHMAALAAVGVAVASAVATP